MTTTSGSDSMPSSSSSPPDSSLDLDGPPILQLEHFNFDHPSTHQAQLFYASLLSLTPDPHSTALKSDTTWMNLGQNQLHLPLASAPNRLDGSVGLIIPAQAYAELPARYRELSSLLPDTQLSLQVSQQDSAAIRQHLSAQWGVDSMEFSRVVSPWGNVFDVYPAASDVGIAYGHLLIPASVDLSSIDHYFSHYFQTATRRLAPNLLTVSVGERQLLLFESTTALTLSADGQSVNAGWHFCLYLSKYYEVFHRLQADGLVATFAGRSDWVVDWAEAKRVRQFRAYRMGAGERTWCVEQELRSGKHRHYMRQLVNEPQPWPLEMDRRLREKEERGEEHKEQEQCRT